MARIELAQVTTWITRLAEERPADLAKAVAERAGCGMGKARSLVRQLVDLGWLQTTGEGRKTLERLIAGADVLVQNLKPGSMDKLGFTRERLREDYPGLIICTISGYGDEGPYAERKAYDLLIQAESGLASITGAVTALEPTT